MNLATAAAVVFTVAILGTIGFQLAMALGAPWGEYAMGGQFPGKFPPAMRVAALVQVVVLALLAVVVLSNAGVVPAPWPNTPGWAEWAVVAFSAVSLLLNSISRSAKERSIWVPVAVVLLLSSLVVALSEG